MTTPTSTPGRTIGGRYALLSTVGAGGMGTVWRAHDQLLRRDVAVKEVLLPPGVPRAERQMLCERTLREARAAASLNNPSVVRIYDVVEEDDRPWIVMELVAARSLAEIITDSGPMPPHVVADVGLQVLGALEAAHAAGILHRDVKPGNILVSEDGRATLTDFGVARSSGDSALTSTGLLLGSPSYIPPERARGRPAVPASDLWALGATLYTAVEGRPPYDRGDPVSTLTAIVSDPPPSFHLARSLRPTLVGLLEKEPDQRWDVRRARDGFRDAMGVSRADVTNHLASGATRAFGPLPSTVAPSGAPAPPLQAPRQAPPEPAWHPAEPSGRRADRHAHDSPRRAGRVALAITLVIILAGAAAAGGYLLTRERSRAPGATSSPRPSPAPVTPAGFVRFEHPAGFSVAVPERWTKEDRGNGVIQFNDPTDEEGGGRFLRLLAAPVNGTIEDYFNGADRDNKSQIEGYQLIGIRESTAGTRKSVDWEFTHTRDGNRHVLDRGFVINRTAYTVYLSTREDQFSASTQILDDATRSFALAG